MAFFSTLFGMAGHQTEQLEVDETQSSNTLRASSPFEDRDTPNASSSQGRQPSNDTASLYPDIQAQVPEMNPAYPDLPDIEEIQQDGLALLSNLERQHKELQERAVSLKEAKSQSKDHKAELDLERSEIQAEEEKLERRKASYRNQQERQAEIDTNVETLNQEWEQAKLRFENLKRKVQRLSSFSVNEVVGPSPSVSSGVATVPDAEDLPDIRAPTSNNGTCAATPPPLGDLSSEDQDKLTELWNQCTVIECIGPDEFVHVYCHECGANASPVSDGSPSRFFGFLRGLRAHYDQCHPSHPPRSAPDVWHICGKTPLSPEEVDAIVHCDRTGEVQDTIRPVAKGKPGRRGSSKPSRSESRTLTPSSARPGRKTIAAVTRKGTPKSDSCSAKAVNVGDDIDSTKDE